MLDIVRVFASFIGGLFALPVPGTGGFLTFGSLGLALIALNCALAGIKSLGGDGD